jgi:hypothetical protein
MATTEHTINDAIAGLLRETRCLWRNVGVISSENTGMLQRSNARPDILIAEPLVSPVVIETEVLPNAQNVEKEALSRLGHQLQRNGIMILSSIAVRLPESLRVHQGEALKAALSASRAIEMVLFMGNSPLEAARWPSAGWIKGTIADLSMLVQSASIPPEIIDRAADHLIDGVTQAAGLLEDLAKHHSGTLNKISELLHQEDDPQTRRMAVTIVANAFIFHESLAGGAGELAKVRSFDEIRAEDGHYSKEAFLLEWEKILKVNYWPIFDIARRILTPIPAESSPMFILRLVETARRLLENRLMRSHDLMGAVFQRLIVDRKFLAAYYTTPASAALLVGLALSLEHVPNGGDWSHAADVTSLRIADFACGTGTLLSTIYQRVGQLHEMAGGDAEAIHPAMMATALVGCDVLPAATHLTASMLSGAHPAVKYEGSSILTLPYGKQDSGEIALGSLDLLSQQPRLAPLAITSRVLQGTGTAEEQSALLLPHESFDVVIMNPPFTRSTNHEGSHANTPNPVFAAFGSTAEEQRLMSRATQALTRGTSADGNAGEASIFLALADRKLKPDGVLAMVMPMTVLSGSSWEKSRNLLYQHYTDLILITVAGIDGAEMSFSADTGMAECLIIGRKAEKPAKRATFVILNTTPAYPLIGATIAEQVRRLLAAGDLRRLDEGTDGGSPLMFGEDLIGQAIDAPVSESGTWNLTRIRDLSLAQAAYQMIANKRLWLPMTQAKDAHPLPLTIVDRIAEVGPVHRDINGSNPDGSIRGPFETRDLQPGSAPTYPVLWAHDAERERTMRFEADQEGVPYRRTGAAEQAAIERKVAQVWATASHCHANLDFRYNSQSTAMQFTARKTIGGRAWLSVKMASVDHEKALVVWANTTLGLLMHWWHASKQQAGRGIITKTTLQTMPVLDVMALSEMQLAEAVRLFDEMCEQPLLPLHESANDPARKALDEGFARRVLGLPESVLEEGGALDLLCQKLSLEPSVRGSK